MSDLKIAVVGAGVIGVTTATELQKRFRNANVTIVADQFFEDTTSYVAAGLFYPSTSFSGPTDEITEKWMQDSYNYWDKIKNSPESSGAGVIERSGYIFSSTIPEVVENPFMEKVCSLHRPVTREELKLCPGNWKYGSYCTTVLTQSSIYIPWALNKFKNSGGRVRKQKIESLESLALENDVLVNCSGLGAKFLCKDRKMVPIRGQIIKVRAPWLENFFFGDYSTYIIPAVDYVTLGGCRQYESWDLNVNKYDEMQIKEKCEAMVPSLAKADVIGSKVGLRPHRGTVRVETEVKSYRGKNVKIVHNYGHGGYGVTTAPGTSLYACDLVYEVLSGNSKL